MGFTVYFCSDLVYTFCISIQNISIEKKFFRQRKSEKFFLFPLHFPWRKIWAFTVLDSLWVGISEKGFVQPHLKYMNIPFKEKTFISLIDKSLLIN